VAIWLASRSREPAAFSEISDASRRSGPHTHAPDWDRNSRQLVFSDTVAAAVQPASPKETVDKVPVSTNSPARCGRQIRSATVGATRNSELALPDALWTGR
jgi:hypothetical protein